MGIGLGLLNAFTVDEVRAVVAHEFGHFHGGDTRLGPWVYKTRAAMGRAVVNLQNTMHSVSEIEAIGFVLAIIEAPFRWMALGYMRLASAVSRAQEFSADAVAARTVGSAPVLESFGKHAGTAAAVDAYFETEIGTLVEHGVLAGARQFVEANRAKMAEIDADHAKFGEASPFDSHPPLSERIAAIEKLAGRVPKQVGVSDDRPAIALIKHPEKLVRELITQRVAKPLESVEWSEVAPLFVAQLHYSLSRHRGWLAERSVTDLDRQPQTARTLAGMLEGIGEYAYELELDILRRAQAQIYTAAIGVALEHIGYEPRTGPGEPLVFVQADQRLELSAIVRDYLAGELSDDARAATWEGAGLHERPWADIAWKNPPSRFAD